MLLNNNTGSLYKGGGEERGEEGRGGKKGEERVKGIRSKGRRRND